MEPMKQANLKVRNVFYRILRRVVPEHLSARYPVVRNVFGTRCPARALVSYLHDPLLDPGFRGHSNYQEVVAICDVLRDKGFNVDVMHFLDERKIDYSGYNLVIGFGSPFNRSHLCPNNALKVLIATGAHYAFQSQAELRRIRAFTERTGIRARPRRINQLNWGESFLSPFMVLTGNAWTASTYEGAYEGKIFTVPVTSVDFHTGVDFGRDWSTARRHFLWFGSSGLIHKGLDLCLEAFAGLPGLHLHICGPREEEVFHAYAGLLAPGTNTHYHGFCDVKSREFREIAGQCGFVVLPSCSEGQSGSVITAMFSGLIPVVTKECGIDPGEGVVTIPDARVEIIASLAVSLSQRPPAELEEVSSVIRRRVLEENTLESFTSRFSTVIDSILYAEK